VPLLDWRCAPDDEVNAGHHDGWIRSYATALAQFREPLFLRYAWEMNLAPSRARCAGSRGPAGAVAAWQRIRGIFRDVGATNVAFVWCPGVGPPPRTPQRWDAYFPGVDAVDWIGVDGYVRDADPHAARSAFRRVFGQFYERFSRLGKPLMIAETGALPRAQSAYLSNLARLLPAAYPQVKALVYFDAPGPRGDWSLTMSGRRAFVSLATHPYFSFRGSG
jgi:beta-mannanase